MPGTVLSPGGSVVRKTVRSIQQGPSKEGREILKHRHRWIDETPMNVKNSLKEINRALR